MIVAAGLLGSVLLAIGGLGVGAPPTRLDVPLALPMCVVGVPVLLGAWWWLRAASAAVVLGASALWSLPLLVGPPLFSRDVYAYAGQAQVVLAGLDPYVDGPSDVPGRVAAEVDEVWAQAPSPYGPVFLWLAARVVQVTGDRPLAAAYGMRLLAVVGVLLVAWALPRLAASHGVAPSRALWLGVANPLVLLHFVGGAHNDALMVGLLVAGLVAPLPVAAVLVTLAGLVKAPALVALAFLPLLAAQRLRAVVVVALVAPVTAVAVTAATGLGWGWLSTLSAGNPRRSLLSPTTGLGVLVDAVDVVHLGGLVVAALVSAWLLWRARDIGAVPALGLVLLAVVLLGPVVQPWYLLWPVVVLAAVASPRAAIGLAAGSALACLLVLPSGRHVVRPPLYGVPMLAVVALAAAVTARGAPTPRTT